ncbi:MAG: hypothetical protein WC455_09605 [Dehalococcoidia bacterium]|jgi:hypothetical protein
MKTSQELRKSVNTLAKMKRVKVHQPPAFLDMQELADRMRYAELMNESEQGLIGIENIENKWQSNQNQLTCNIIVFYYKWEWVEDDKEEAETDTDVQAASEKMKQEIIAQSKSHLQTAIDNDVASEFDGEYDPDDLARPGSV